MQNQNQNHKPHQNNAHQPVLLEPLLELLDPQPGERYLDLTAGYGGHAAAIAERIGDSGSLTLVDRDAQAVEALERSFSSQAEVIHSDFASALDNLVGAYDLVLADIGVSSPQLDSPNRGFSFKSSAPLDMRMDETQEMTAADIVNTFSQKRLADLIYMYGQERQSRQIAKAIVDSRPHSDTKSLATVIARAYKGKSRIHPATRTFQAIRIAVNDELNQLEQALPRIETILATGGRMAVISFHSLEDRIVKNYIRESRYLDPLNKKVVQGKFEDVSNPRARSAKLRAALKIQTAVPGALKQGQTGQK